MPMMNAAQVRALSVEDIARFPEFPNEVPVNDYSRRPAARQIADGGRTKWYDIKYDGNHNPLDVVEWMLEASHKLSQVCQGDPSALWNEERLAVTASIKEKATEEQKEIALQWLANNPQPAPDPANVIKWWRAVPFTTPQEGAIQDDYVEQF